MAARVIRVRDSEQDALDLADAQLRLQRLGAAIEKKDGADQRVQQLRQQLRQAIRQAKEAGWDVGLLLERERRETRTVQAEKAEGC